MEPQTLALALNGHPSWKGTMVGLRFEPLIRRSSEVVFFGLRFVRQGWVPAHGVAQQPDAADPETMWSVHSVALRAWPSSFGVPLLASALALALTVWS